MAYLGGGLGESESALLGGVRTRGREGEGGALAFTRRWSPIVMRLQTVSSRNTHYAMRQREEGGNGGGGERRRWRHGGRTGAWSYIVRRTMEKRHNGSDAGCVRACVRVVLFADGPSI